MPRGISLVVRPEQIGLALEICAFCDEAAELRCDFHLGVVGPVTRENILEAMPTCDTLMCRRHRKFVSAIHFDGTKGGRRHGWTETVDHCPIHAHETRDTTPNATAADIERARAEILDKIERYRRASKEGTWRE